MQLIIWPAIKYTSHEITPLLLSIFNTIFESGIFPSNCGKSVIGTIYKNGRINNPGNYRGISITDTLYKVFSTIVNTRLYNWAENNNQIDESQVGFRHGYSTIDNIFCLQAMVQKYLTRT